MVRWLIIVALAVRIMAAAVLVLGPWVDEPAELAGWDVARFQALADTPGRPWVDHQVEYPPGSVVVIKALTALAPGPGVVGTHRLLVVASLLVDLALAALVHQLGGARSAATYLWLGLPLVPMGLLRLDLWATALAVAALWAASRRRDGAAGLLVVAAALLKVWPVLLLAPLVALGRWRAVTVAVTAGAAAGAAWLAYAGWSLDAPDQVLSLRGATGWHLESVPGSVAALAGHGPPRLELDAYRIGRIEPGLVLAGRLVTAAVIATLMALAHRWRWPADGVIRPSAQRAVGSPPVVSPPVLALPVLAPALVMTGATATLVVTAPLLSPQFLLWLTPWAALCVGPRPGARWVVGLTGVATVLTGAVLAGYGPSGLAGVAPAIMLLARDLALAGVALTATVRLWNLNPALHE